MLDLVRQTITTRFGRDRPTARASATLVLGSAVGQGLLLVGTLLAARRLEPAAFGVLGVFAAFAVLFGMLASGRFEAAVPIPRRNHRARDVLAVGAVLVPIVAAISWVGMETFGRPALDWADASALNTLPWAIPAATLAIGFRALALGWATRRGMLSAMAAGRVANGGAMAVVFATSAWIDPRVEWLVVGWLVGQSAELVVVATAIATDPGIRERGGGHHPWRRAVRRYRRFPTVLVWSHLLEQLDLQLPTALVSGGFGADIAGQFNLVQRIVVRPLAIIGSSASVVLISESARVRRAGGAVRPVLRACLRRLAILALVVYVPVALVGPWAMPMILGDEWSAAGIFLLAMIPGVVVDFIAVPVHPLLGLLERPWNQVAGSVLRSGLIASAIAGGAAAGVSPTTMVVAVSIATVLAGGVSLAMCRSATAIPRRPDPRRPAPREEAAAT